jgi:integrase
VRGIHKVKRKLADGSVRVHYYAWRGGPKIEAPPNTDAFWIEYWDHKRAAVGKHEKTLANLIDDFTGPEGNRTVAFRQLARSTQTDYLYAYKLTKQEWPSLPVRLTQQKGMRRSIEKWRDKFADNPRKADKLLFALSKAFSYAVAGEVIDKNPCHGITRLYQGTRREEVWSREQIGAFRAKAPLHILLAFELAIGTGQRQGDLLAAAWKQYDGVYLRFEIGKSRKAGGPGKRVRVKIHARLKKLLDAKPQDTLRILTNSRGRPWTNMGFQASWKKALKKAGVSGVTFHDLRGTFITERRREGSSIEDIALITGHSIGEVKSILERHYLADDQEMSDAVILRMEHHEQNPEAPIPSQMPEGEPGLEQTETPDRR